jgi:hypothetical protein
VSKSTRAKVAATELQSKEEVFHPDVPGAYFIDAGPKELGFATIYYICPCGCGEMNSLPIATGEKRQQYWQWNGKLMKATLSPSIKRMNACKYHGYLTNGEWTFAGDSGK